MCETAVNKLSYASSGCRILSLLNTWAVWAELPSYNFQLNLQMLSTLHFYNCLFTVFQPTLSASVESNMMMSVSKRRIRSSERAGLKQQSHFLPATTTKRKNFVKQLSFLSVSFSQAVLTQPCVCFRCGYSIQINFCEN